MALSKRIGPFFRPCPEGSQGAGQARKKAAQNGAALAVLTIAAASALAGLEAWLCLVDYVNTALAANDAAVAMAALERAQRISDLHWSSPGCAAHKRLLRFIFARKAKSLYPDKGRIVRRPDRGEWWAVQGSNL